MIRYPDEPLLPARDTINVRRGPPLYRYYFSASGFPYGFILNVGHTPEPIEWDPMV